MRGNGKLASWRGQLGREGERGGELKASTEFANAECGPGQFESIVLLAH